MFDSELFADSLTIACRVIFNYVAHSIQLYYMYVRISESQTCVNHTATSLKEYFDFLLLVENVFQPSK